MIMINSIACWRNCCLVWTVILHSLCCLGQGFPEGVVQYEGQIGGYAIAAILEQDGDSIHGVYVYQSKNIPIAMHGVRSGNGQWLLEEFSGDWNLFPETGRQEILTRNTISFKFNNTEVVLSQKMTFIL